MVIAYHIIFGTYGFWLPNDPRGSWSDFVWSWDLFRYGGKATKVETRRSVASAEHDIEKRKETKQHLKYTPVVFNGIQARAVAMGFKTAAERFEHPVLACSIMPDHVHLVFGRCRYKIEKVVSQFKQQATIKLNEENIKPEAPKPWGESCWKVYLNDDESVRRAIEYVERNPIKEGKKPQRWSFVKPFR